MSEIFSKKKVKTLDIETEMCFCQSDTRRTSTWGRGWRTTDGSRGWRVWIYGGFVARCVHQSGAAYSPGGGSPSLSPLTHTAHTSSRRKKKKKTRAEGNGWSRTGNFGGGSSPPGFFVFNSAPAAADTHKKNNSFFLFCLFFQVGSVIVPTQHLATRYQEITLSTLMKLPIGLLLLTGGR